MYRTTLISQDSTSKAYQRIKREDQFLKPYQLRNKFSTPSLKWRKMENSNQSLKTTNGNGTKEETTTSFGRTLESKSHKLSRLATKPVHKLLLCLEALCLEENTEKMTNTTLKSKGDARLSATTRTLLESLREAEKSLPSSSSHDVSNKFMN